MKLLIPVLTLLILAGGCLPSFMAPDPPDFSDAELEPAIVRAIDLLKVPGLTVMRRLTEVDNPGYVGPNFKGPCGSQVEQPATTKRLAAAFRGSFATISQVVAELEPEDGRRIIDDLRDSLDTECEPQSLPSSEGPLTYQQGESVLIGPMGEDRVGYFATTSLGDETAFLGEIVIRSGSIVSYVILSSQAPIAPETLASLAELADPTGKGVEGTI